MNSKSIATHGLAFLIGGVVFSFFAFNLASANFQRQREAFAIAMAIEKQSAGIDEDRAAQYKAAHDHCEDAVTKIYGTETVLYEAVAPKISVMHGAVDIQAGDRLQIQSQLQPKWLIGMRVTPQLAPGIATGVAYGYVDKKTGEVTGPFQVTPR